MPDVPSRLPSAEPAPTRCLSASSGPCVQSLPCVCRAFVLSAELVSVLSLFSEPCFQNLGLPSVALSP